MKKISIRALTVVNWNLCINISHAKNSHSFPHNSNTFSTVRLAYKFIFFLKTGFESISDVQNMAVRNVRV